MGSAARLAPEALEHATNKSGVDGSLNPSLELRTATTMTIVPGMREHFAALALQALLANPNLYGNDPAYRVQDAARTAVAAADALIAALRNPKP